MSLLKSRWALWRGPLRYMPIPQNKQKHKWSYWLGRHPGHHGPGQGNRATWCQIGYWNQTFMEQGRQPGSDLSERIMNSSGNFISNQQTSDWSFKCVTGSWRYNYLGHQNIQLELMKPLRSEVKNLPETQTFQLLWFNYQKHSHLNDLEFCTHEVNLVFGKLKSVKGMCMGRNVSHQKHYLNHLYLNLNC